MLTIVRDLGVSLPLILVYVLGLGIALSQVSTRPRVAAAAGTSFALLLLLQVLRPVPYFFFNRLVNEFDIKPDTYFALMGGLNFVFNLLAAVGIGGLLLAIFADRQPTASQPSNAPWPQKPVV